MKAILLATVCVVASFSNAVAERRGGGGGGGNAFLGGVLGGALGGVIGGAMNQPPPPPTYYAPPPVYYVPPPRTVYVPLSRAPAVVAFAPAVPPDPDSSSYQEGARDRDLWEAWYAKLEGSERDGAYFWSDQRNKPNPMQCPTRITAIYNNDWIDGCTSAKRRLIASDQRRRVDAQYRNGWNKVVPDEPQNTARAISVDRSTTAEKNSPSIMGIFDADMLNVQVPFLETTTGPAKRIITLANGNTVRYYTVEHCSVTAHVKGTEVYAYGLVLSPSCNVNLKPLLGNNTGSTSNLTLGRFVNAEGAGTLRAQCLTSCGNADDTTVSFHWTGPHANQYLEVKLVLLTTSVGDGVDRWREVMQKKEGREYVNSLRFNCDNQYDEVGQTLLNKSKIQEIIVGFGLEDEDDSNKASCAKTN